MMTISQAFQLALQHHQAGRPADAEVVCRAILERSPTSADALHLLGVIACQDGRFELAVECIGRAITISPVDASYHSNYGTALQASGRLEEAIVAHQMATGLQPGGADIHYNLANTLRDAGKLQSAAAAYRTALALKPDDAEARSNLGSVLNSQGDHESAAEECRKAIATKPDYAPAYNNLAIALQGQGRPEAAVAACRTVLDFCPDFAEAHHTLANALKDQGELDDAIAGFRQALALRPNEPRIHSHLIYTLHFHPGYDARAIAEEAVRWNAVHAAPFRKFQRPHTNARDSSRRLRIGYLSPDFSGHVIGRNLWPLVRCHDRERFEIFCYSDVLKPDSLTALFRTRADHWRETVGVPNAQLAEQIRADQVDILVDLALHTDGGRLALFASRPAPVQLSFGAYPGSARVEDIPYHLSDRHLEPPGKSPEYPFDEAICLESFWCYDPLDGGPEVNALPAGELGTVTFGSLNNFCKVNAVVLDLWGQVLGQVPGSRMVLLAHPGSQCQRVIDLLSRHGVDPLRVEFVGWQPRRQYLECHHRIDIMLDTFPYNGHTTSLDAIWMGVPVVSLAGQVPVSRGGLSIFTNVGLGELVAKSEQDFVRIAVDLANDIPRLRELRRMLRARMEASLLMDAPRFTHQIEDAYRAIWRRWCAEKQS